MFKLINYERLSKRLDHFPYRFLFLANLIAFCSFSILLVPLRSLEYVLQTLGFSVDIILYLLKYSTFLFPLDTLVFPSLHT